MPGGLKVPPALRSWARRHVFHNDSKVVFLSRPSPRSPRPTTSPRSSGWTGTRPQARTEAGALEYAADPTFAELHWGCQSKSTSHSREGEDQHSPGGQVLEWCGAGAAQGLA